MNKLSRVLVAIALALDLGACQAHQAKDDPDQPVATQVQAQIAVRQIEPVQVRAEATIVADPQYVSRVSSTQAQAVLRVYVRVGDTVKRGQPLVDLAQNPQAQADVTRTTLELAAARKALAREEALVRGGVDPQVMADQQRTDLGIALAQARAARTQLALMQANSHLRAPMAGVVVQVDANVGAVTTPGADLVSIADPHRLLARLQVEPADLAKLRPDQAVALTVPGATDSLPARVSRVSATLNADTQLGEADAELLPPILPLGIGRFATARVTVGHASDLLVPATALIHRDDGDKVYLAISGKAREVPVQRGARYGDRVAVTGSIPQGATVITSGAYELSDGDPVTIGDRVTIAASRSVPD